MPQKTITIAVKVGVFSGRDILSGMLAFTDSDNSWHYRIIQSEADMTNEALCAAARESDGFIIALGGNLVNRFLRDSHKPVVYISQRLDITPAGPVAVIRNDNMAIGKTAGDYLISLGAFRSYAYVHSRPKDEYTQPREKGFRSVLKSHGIHTAPAYLTSHDEGSDEDIANLARWLASLPKPTAVMAGCDRRALHVLAAARQAGIQVPGQLAVVGVDNDELLVEHSSPPLSSVQPGHFEMGFTAAVELKRLMSAHRRTSVRITNVPPKRVVVRESTRHLPPAVMLVERAKKFIAERAVSGIGVEEVVAHLGCSRNLADLRYKAAEGLTIHAAIEAARLEAVKRLLKTTRRPVAAIAVQCGFKSANRLTHLFRQRFGLTIRDWRSK